MIEQVTVIYKNGTMGEDFESLEAAGLREDQLTAVCTITSNVREIGIEFEVHHHYKIAMCEVWFKMS